MLLSGRKILFARKMEFAWYYVGACAGVAERKRKKRIEQSLLMDPDKRRWRG